MRSSGVAHVVRAGRQALPCPSEAEHASGSACFGTDVTFACSSTQAISSYHAGMARDTLHAACR